ncbi:histidine kinase A domain protein [Marvinbryantia formatexigens DSM 14469]|uniref:histidine kinase n=1 Tax=Marvinbryantia formatexigens DSM 14469 TaxID=478749 RepID=C6LF71_9FIRM|nr:HAMP domain-containing sensor histidine kinase [Marvinbryantia formatexigens]EET60810.1 histidine kinase A domain protein [Marvinbryantia formatexigens DSM 14469]UWO26854.1 HAMP domain-containing histidine kinase [Marvinbryantia formatexigens DSM 14469]SDG32038.1 Signal transduction histidine kinase [Marvinbryantia formatexigens]
MNKRNSIYFRLLKLLVIAMTCTVIVYSGMEAVSAKLLEYYFEHSDYTSRQNDKRINNLQEYIRDNQIKASDAEELTRWVKKQSVVSIQVYRSGMLVYDSNYPEEEAIQETPSGREFYDWETYYILEFEDGQAEVILSGFYDYQIYWYVTLIGLLISFALFLVIVMLGIRKTMKYIRTLSTEIGILEGGDLNYEITVKGKDELAVLAQSLNSMRESFKAQIEQDAYLTQASRKMITEMSHDLRTPLTSIMLYTEILLKNKCRDEEQKISYIQKINHKARRLKKLSDHLFEYALITGETEVKLEGPYPVKAVFYDLLSETVSYLEQEQFHVALTFTWESYFIRINQGYVARIFDNLTSNIVKYADREAPVLIQSVSSQYSVGIAMKNRKKIPDGKNESNKIGLQNVQKMMEKMGGRFVLENDEKDFAVTLLFPIAASKCNKTLSVS